MKIRKHENIRLIIDGIYYILLIMVIISTILVVIIPIDIAHKLLFLIIFIMLGYILIKPTVNPKVGGWDDR